MPRIGNVEVSDDVLQSLQRTAAASAPRPARPGLLDVLGAAAQGAYGQVRYGVPYQAATLAGGLTQADEQFYREGLARTAAAASRAAPAGLEDVTSGRVGISRWIGENVVASLPYMVGAAAGALAGGAAGSAVPGFGTAAGAIAGGIAGGIPQFSGSNVARAVEEEGGLSQAAAERSLMVAPAQAAADVAIGRFLPGAGKVLGDLASRPAGSFLRRTAASMVQAGGTEAVTEAAQQIGERYAAGLNLSDSDAAAEYVNAAVTAFAVGGVLGAGGGFNGTRRMAADAKPPEMVTGDDITEKLNAVLALPAPPDFTVNSAGTATVNPSGTQQLMLPPPERFSTPDIYVDAAGRAAMAPPEGISPVELANMPRPSAPSQQELLSRVQQAQQPEAIMAPNVAAQPPAAPTPQAATSAAALTNTPVGQTPQIELPPTATRAFRDVPVADLTTALSSKSSDPRVADIQAQAQRELSARWAEAAGTEPLTTDDYQTRVDELKTGLRGGWVQSLEASDPVDLVDKVYTRVFDDADTSANVAKLAQRVGLLDADLNPTPLATQIEQQRMAALQAEAGVTPMAEQAQPGQGAATAEPAPLAPVTRELAGVVQGERTAAAPSSIAAPQAPVDPAFSEQWDQLKRAAGITRLRSGQDVLGQTPANLQQAQAQVVRALATDTSNAEVSQVEKLARQMGLVTDDDAMDITPLGRQAYLSTPEGLEETVLAARQQGYEGAQASIFDRGVRAQIAGEAAPTFTDFGDMAAYEAGQVWARNFVQNDITRTAAQTEAIQNRQASRQTGTPVAREQVRRELSPQQVQQQALNNLLDMADMSGVSDSDVVALRRMVAAGASTGDVGAALQQVQGGRTLFQQPPSAPVNLSRPEGRGQPLFREMYDPAESTPTRAEQRAQTEEAVQAHDMRTLIDFAKAEGGITDARAARLHDMLDQGKVSQVKTALKAFDPDARPASRLPTPPETVFEKGASGRSTGDADAQFEAGIDGKDFNGAVDYMIEQAPSKYMREVMRKVKGLSDRLGKAGVTLDLRVIRPGDVAPVVLNRPDVRAFTVSERNPARSTVYLKASEMGETSGTNFQLAAHEMLHAVTDRLVNWGSRPENANTKVGKDVKDLLDLGNAIITNFNEKIASGQPLSEFEQAMYDRQNNALANAHEIISWGLTNPDMQRYLQSIEYKPRQSVFSRLVELLRNLLGLDGKYDTALTELLRVSERVMKAGQPEIQSAYALNNASGLDTEVLTSPALETGAPNATPQAANDITERAAAWVTNTFNRDALRGTAQELRDRMRRIGLPTFSRQMIDQTYGDVIPGLRANTRAHEARVSVRNIFQLAGENSLQNIERLRQSSDAQSRKDAERINNLMRDAQFGIDGAKTWEEHTHLHGAVNEANLRKIWVEARNDYNTLARHGNVGVFEEARAANEAQNIGMMLAQLYDKVANDPEYVNGVRGARVSPSEALITSEGLGTATGLRDHLTRELDDRIQAAKDFLQTSATTAASGTDRQRAETEARAAPLRALLSEIAKNRALMEQQPYFHLPRFGDNFAAFTIVKDGDVVDKAALVKVAKALEDAGITDVQLSTDNTNPRVMLRTESRSSADMIKQLGLELEKQGLVEKGSTIGGPRSRADNYGLGGRVPDYISQALERLDADPTFQPDPSLTRKEREALEAQKDAAKQALVDGWLDMLPDNSISKVLAKRRNVQGASDDMIRGFAHRQNLGAVGVASLLTRPQFSDAVRSMRAAVDDAQQAGSEIDPYMVNDVVTEVRRRDAENPVNDMATSFDKIRAISHSYYLGMNPSSSLINMSALGVTVLPELAKRHGAVKSFHAMRRAAVQAASILKASFLDAQQRGWAHRADLSLTENVLDKANLPKDVRDFVRRRIADGDIDLGTMSRALGQVASGKGDTTLDKLLRYGSAFNLYSEAFARLVAAISARDLHGSGNSQAAHDYARSVVKDTLFEFQPGATGRAFGKQGILGPVTPMVTQFMQWNLQVTEKLAREFRDALGKQRTGETAEAAAARRAEAQKFLLGHMTAMTALAGSLGLPFATVAATVVEKLVGDDDEPFDATAAWRNFLSDVLGKDMGEVVARGLPRALGFDVSTRAGEQNLLPFSEFLADKRSWQDAITDNVGRSIGAAPNMVVSVLDGGNKIASGDLIGGMKQILPVSLKNPLEVYRMTSEGYVDAKGNKLPMTPKATDIMWQLMGFTPAQKGEYNEARGDTSARQGVISRRAGMLRQRIFQALDRGDMDSARELVTDAIAFDKANPAFAITPSLMTAYQSRQQAQALAQAMGTPRGVSLRDVAGQQLTGYANF